MNTKWIGLALIYIAFFSLIGMAIYFTHSLWALWALLLTPTFSSKSDE